eukprot:gene3520-3975_t
MLCRGVAAVPDRYTVSVPDAGGTRATAVSEWSVSSDERQVTVQASSDAPGDPGFPGLTGPKVAVDYEHKDSPCDIDVVPCRALAPAPALSGLCGLCKRAAPGALLQPAPVRIMRLSSGTSSAENLQWAPFQTMATPRPTHMVYSFTTLGTSASLPDLVTNVTSSVPSVNTVDLGAALSAQVDLPYTPTNPQPDPPASPATLSSTLFPLFPHAALPKPICQGPRLFVTVTGFPNDV